MFYFVSLCYFLLMHLLNIIIGCTTPMGIFLGGLIGILSGIIYWAMLYYTESEKLLYFQPETSNNVVCNRPSKQTFRCKVYKNGKLIKTTTTKK